MTRIGLLSDTHGYFDERYFTHFASCDEIWHCGDIGSDDLAERLAAFRPLRAVYGNIDGGAVRFNYSEFLAFRCEEVNVLMTHIGGYPGRYSPQAYRKILADKPNLFVCGHSHILKVQYDNTLQMLTMNPGAAGIYGFHQVRTLLRFEIDGRDIRNLEVIEMPKHTVI